MAGNLGFETYLVEDATATFDQTGHKGHYYSAEQIHDVSLANIHGEFAEVLSSEQLFLKLSE